MQIKICGITCSADAKLAAEAGAHAVGMVAHPKAVRAVTQEEALAIAATLPSRVTPVLLFVDDPAEEVRNWLQLIPVATLQFHGDEPASYCESFKAPYIKAIHPSTQAEVHEAMRLYAKAEMLLLDGGKGSGESFDWSLVPAPNERTVPIGIAGGLSATNVGTAVAQTSPDWVDVSSGVCASDDPRRKDLAAVVSFTQAAEAEVAHD